MVFYKIENDFFAICNTVSNDNMRASIIPEGLCFDRPKKLSTVGLKKLDSLEEITIIH